MTTTISNLPRDLIEEIISRLPLKSMRAVRLTCKKWDTLSKSRSFTKMHIGKEAAAATREGGSQMVVLMDYKLYLMNVVDDDPSTKPKGKLTCLKYSDQVRISKVFHCEGLLLCILKEDTRVVVWNPYCGQTRWIEPTFFHRPENGDDIFCYALGYEDKKSCRSHKLLRFIDNYPLRNQIRRYEIYDFDSDLWTTLVVDPQSQWIIFKNLSLGVSLKGNTYFIATKRNPRPFIEHIICFDFTKERFGQLLHLPFVATAIGLVTLSCVREEKLAALNYHGPPGQVDIWITTTKIEAEKDMSWSKFLTVAAGPSFDFPLIPCHGSFVIDEVKKVALLFDRMDDRSRTYTITGEAGGYVRVVDPGKYANDHPLPLMCPFVPSLAQIKQPARKRKRQSSLNQNLLRLVAPAKEQLYGTGTRRKRIDYSIFF